MTEYGRREAGGPFTIHEYANLPADYQEGTELVRGWIVREPPPAAPHARLHALLAYYLVEYAKRTGLGAVFVEGGFVTNEDPPTVRGPDIACVLADRLRAPGDGDPYMRPAPDLAIEILSPSNRPAQMREKVREYFAAGSHLVWIIDPVRQTAVVHHPDGGHEPLGAADILSGGGVLPGFELPLAELFTNA